MDDATMTNEQKQKALALGRCTFPVGSNQKRFAHTMYDYAKNNEGFELSEKQAKYLDTLFHSYRRQMKVAHARYCDCDEAKKI
jgi:hypothetical protein